MRVLSKNILLTLMVFGIVGCATTPTTYDSEDIGTGIYIGEWKNGKWNGQGTFTYSDGVKYVGGFKDYYFHGQGSYTEPDGTSYVGGYKYNDRHGYGTQTIKGRVLYVGEWTDNKVNGRGTYYYENGDKYAGEFKDGKLHGKGVISYPNGENYIGHFINGQLIDTSEDLNQQDGNLAIDLIKSAGELVLGGLYIAIAVAGSPEALEYQESKNQKAREEAAYIRGKKECQQTKKC